MRCRAALLSLLVALALPAYAGGPLVVATDGRAIGWDTSRPVGYDTDQGPLGLLANATAVAIVERLFGTWTDVPTAAIGFARTGTPAFDVTGANFGPFLGPYGGATAPRGRTTVVFDADGAIFDTLFGIGTGVLGFAGPTFLSDGVTTVPIGDPVPPGAHIVEGIAFLNGKWIDGVDAPASGNFELSLPRFEAVFVHEFGHLAGLDHTQIHGLYGSPAADSPLRTTPVETMFPFAVDDTQATLGRDDVVALSALYPIATFAAGTGAIAGRVLAADGMPFSGANVIARNVADDADAVSCVSGAVGPAGGFTLAGLQPGATYTVEVQEIDAFHSGGSRVGPLSPPVPLPGPAEFYTGAAESADPTTDDSAARTPIVAVAGATVGPIHIVLNRQRFVVTNVALETGSQPNGFVLADLDRDGILDLATTQIGFTPGNQVRLHRGLGGGRFAAPVTIGSFPGNAHPVVAHYNRDVDAFVDLAVASDTLNEVRVYLGDGAGSLALPRTVLDLPNGGPGLRGLMTGDLNADAYPDLVTVVESVDGSAAAYALLGNGIGTFTTVRTPLSVGSGFPRTALVAADIAGTRALDVVGIASGGGPVSGPPALGILVGDGTGAFTAQRTPLDTFTNAIDQRALAAGDLNGDGFLDVAFSNVFPVGGPNNWTRSFVDLLLGDGAGGFRLGTRYAVPETSQSGLVATDVDGDGRLDLVSTGARFERGSPGARVTIALGDGQGGVRAVETTTGLAEFPTRLVAADLDGDRRTDLVVDDGEASAFGLAHAPAYSVLLQTGPPLPPPPPASTTTTTSTTTTRPPTTITTTTTTTTSTTTSTTTPPTVPAVLTAVADTYIEAGTQATWDHGAADHVDIDLSPLRIAYVKFDLRAVTAAVRQATLLLTCRNASVDGGTVFAVHDSTWIEGTRTGADGSSAGGPGLTWAQVDTTRDGRIDSRDASPWVPDTTLPLSAPGPIVVGQRIAVDVTPALQRGPGLYTLAVRSASTDRGAYAAREASVIGDRPQLRLVFGAALPPTTTTTTSSTTSTSSTTTTTRPATIVILPPFADTHVVAGSEAAWDHGTCAAVKTDLSPFAVTFLRFDLRGVAGRVVRATLELSCTNPSPDGGTLYPVADSPWIEGDRCGSGGPGLRLAQVDCNGDGRLDTGDTCATAPAFDRPLASIGRVVLGTRIAADVTAAVSAGPGVYTIALRNGNTDGAAYASREAPTLGQRPRLRLELAPGG